MELSQLTLILSLLAWTGQAIITDPLKYVDPLIGTQAGGKYNHDIEEMEKGKRTSVTDYMAGNVFAGASLPYGLAKAVADTDSQSNQGGFTTDGANITGFSSMHDSGTGYAIPTSSKTASTFH